MSGLRRSWSRREFVEGLALAATVGVLRMHAEEAAAEPPPETTTLRMLEIPALCWAPQYVVEELLRAEGFARVQYVKRELGPEIFQPLGSGEADISMGIAGPVMIRIDTGDPIVIIAGVHAGCYELFAAGRVRTISDLKGKTVAVRGLGSSEHLMLAMLMAFVGMDPRKDLIWVAHRPEEAMRMLAEGQVDAYMAFPPEPQELRAKKIGRVIWSMATDRPWSQYFCCMAAGNAEFIRRNPVGTKRALRAILKAADLCAAQPEQMATSLVNRGRARDYDYTVQAIKDVRYDRWREYNPEETVRFYALRLHEVGMLKSSPKKIIAQGTDWRFFNELRKELKA
jgi:NitT/TauT family transport system substrate-binding protein